MNVDYKAQTRFLLQPTSEYLRRAGKNLLNSQQLPQKAKTFFVFQT